METLLIFPNTLSGLEKFQKMLNKYGLNSNNVLVGMEATGHYWLVLYSWLIEQDFDVKVINPLVTDAYRKMYIRKTKNDRIDAEVVARVILLGDYHETPVAEETTLSLRQLCPFQIISSSNHVVDLKRKCIAILDQVFPEYSPAVHPYLWY